ncbi:hypothetical protein N0V82_001428 [Gnomoniopsis sp. IMI 355080]|nr:hypothetical protein N0V82_001428 [Gnomoniopsis sp. IMI 355080]
MPLELRPAVEGDMYRAAVIERPFPPDILSHRAEEWKNQAKKPGVSFFKVIDTELAEEEQLIAFSLWVTYDANNPVPPTDPKHQGRGAGTLLLRRCVEDAAKNRLPIYLNASPMGHGMYLKHQFRDVETMVTDFSKWGAKDLQYVFAMIKEP